MKTLRNVTRFIRRKGSAIFSRGWDDYSRLVFVSDNPSWSIGHDMREIERLAKMQGIKTGHPWVAVNGGKQSVFIGSHFDLLLLSDRWFQTDHRLATAYFHGKPGQGVAEFDKCFETLAQKHESIHRIQVSCKSMHEVVLESGIDPHKVHLIPIGINPKFFTLQTPESKSAARLRFGISQDAFVVGSFQKDGNGWGEGLEPKMIKGPDVFIETMRLLKQSIKSLVVLLSGPARGYVKEKLQSVGVPYIHHMMKKYSDVGHLYQALDVYVVSSREEGGPKSVLEAMASGIPLVTTKVGQANDLIQHGVNGFLVDVEDASSLATWTAHVFENENSTRSMVKAGKATAELHCYNAQLPLWEKFFTGFVQ